MTIFIYDNSQILDIDNKVDRFENLDIIYHHDKDNGGLSAGYNMGAKLATELKKTWILLLDQDTTFKNLLESFNFNIQRYPNIHLFAPIVKLNNNVIFSPSIVKHKRGYPPKTISPGIYSLNNFSPINSGMLIALKLFYEVGGYNEKIKVDFCDFQFIEKVYVKNPLFVVVDSVAIQDFSAFEPSVEKQLKRFNIYLNDVHNCYKPSIYDKFGFFYTVTRHTLGLTYKLKSHKFIIIYIKKYLFY
ncbi:glycosyltransferase family protein [Flavobacterium araucananum]|nr:hypothetical protein [Flavobacterium araucananum]